MSQSVWLAQVRKPSSEGESHVEGTKHQMSQSVWQAQVRKPSAEGESHVEDIQLNTLPGWLSPWILLSDTNFIKRTLKYCIKRPF